MIPSLATILAVYAAARLIQTMIEYPTANEPKRDLSAARFVHGLVSFVALAIIFYFWRAIQQAGGGLDFGDPRFR